MTPRWASWGGPLRGAIHFRPCSLTRVGHFLPGSLLFPLGQAALFAHSQGLVYGVVWEVGPGILGLPAHCPLEGSQARDEEFPHHTPRLCVGGQSWGKSTFSQVLGHLLPVSLHFLSFLSPPSSASASKKVLGCELVP